MAFIIIDLEFNNLSEILNKEIVEIKEKNSALKNNIDKYVEGEKGYKSQIEKLNNEIKNLNDKIDATISFDMTLLQPPCGNTAAVLR